MGAAAISETTGTCIVASAEVSHFCKVLHWLSAELQSAALNGKVPEWLTGELMDEFRDPTRLLRATARFTTAPMPYGLVFDPPLRLAAYFAPSPALARAYAHCMRGDLDRDLLALDALVSAGSSDA